MPKIKTLLIEVDMKGSKDEVVQKIANMRSHFAAKKKMRKFQDHKKQHNFFADKEVHPHNPHNEYLLKNHSFYSIHFSGSGG